MYGKQNIAVFRYALELYTQVLAIRANAVKAAANGATRSEPTVTTFSVWGTFWEFFTLIILKGIMK